MATRSSLTRRDFLKLFQANALGLLVPAEISDICEVSERWPTLELSTLPPRVRSILKLTPPAIIDDQGFLILSNNKGDLHRRAPVAQTLWNKEHSHPWDRLDARFPWGIVLHWYGDKEYFKRTIPGYLGGFDSLRKIDNFMVRTSAHFLVSGAYPTPGPVKPDAPFGILQTQLPDRDGTPFLASHLRPLNLELHKEHKQYFVQALYRLKREDPSNHLLLQDLYDGPRIDPNMRTIAIEITGHSFENPSFLPSDQKIANVVALVWALMKRYRIPASHILGHHELTIGKPDPGKKFLALIRYLIGVKALIENNVGMRYLVFGQYLDQDLSFARAAQKYFSFQRKYLVLISYPRSVFEWETMSNYWLLNHTLQGSDAAVKVIDHYAMPIRRIQRTGLEFLIPANHEGVDLYHEPKEVRNSMEATLVADGECMYIGRSKGCCSGMAVMFRHYQNDGAQVLTVYNHLEELGDLEPGRWYSQNTRVGVIQARREHSYLHFAIAYGSTWDTDLRNNPEIPGNAGPTWIRQRYLSPIDHVTRHSVHEGRPIITRSNTE